MAILLLTLLTRGCPDLTGEHCHTYGYWSTTCDECGQSWTGAGYSFSGTTWQRGGDACEGDSATE